MAEFALEAEGSQLMTHLWNDPATFMEDMLAGFTNLYPQYVTLARGGVVRSVEPRDGKVVVIVGGGSGHYPAFCGVVGEGFADGAVVGNIFTSPSADDAYSVAKAASAGGGVLFITGNYAGDVLNFDQATARLRAEGEDVRAFYVTDDLASAPRETMSKRRGIAGDFTVFKVTGAAADAGYSLDDVERLAIHSNANTRTLGVAFAGCTLPGAHQPLFTVAEGKMGLGLGIHGEPGISDEDLPTAEGLARMLVDGIMAELPEGHGPRIAVILNGLGATKYEELFVVWKSVCRLLAEHGYETIEPEVGELVTSLDMAGCSLTIMTLDEELERFWRAAADTPAFKKGVTGHGVDATEFVLGGDERRLHGPECSKRQHRSPARGLTRLERTGLIRRGGAHADLSLPHGSARIAADGTLLECRRVGGRTPEALKLLVQRHDRERAACHVETGDEFADLRLDDLIAVLGQQTGNGLPHNEEFLVLGGTQPVQDHCDARPVSHRELRHDAVHEHPG
jgi:dihydroxyacetone kinase